MRRLLPVLLFSLSACDSGTVKIDDGSVSTEDSAAEDSGVDSGADSGADSGDTGTDSGTDSGGDTGDTGDSGTTDSGDSGDSGSTDTGDSGTTDTATEPEPDYSVWSGTRTFSYESDWGDCTESVEESGEAETSGDAYDAMIGACPSCDYVYVVDLSADSVCDWISLANPTYRGLILGDGTATVYTFGQDRDGDVYAEALDDSADFDGWNLGYAYEIDYGVTIAVTGALVFPELSP